MFEEQPKDNTILTTLEPEHRRGHDVQVYETLRSPSNDQLKKAADRPVKKQVINKFLLHNEGLKKKFYMDPVLQQNGVETTKYADQRTSVNMSNA